jgi:hypothetical protein
MGKGKHGGGGSLGIWELGALRVESGEWRVREFGGELRGR